MGALIPLKINQTHVSHARVPGKALIPVPEIWETGTKNLLEKTRGACLFTSSNSQERQAPKAEFLAQSSHEVGPRSLAQGLVRGQQGGCCFGFR